MKDNWYLLDTEEVLEKLNVDKKGLTNKEVKSNQEKYGLNVLPKKKKDSVFKIILRELLNPIVLLLIVTVVFSLIIGEVVDACAIIFIILIDLILGTFQEWKAEKTAESLQELIKDKVRVIRNGEETEVDSEELTIGDIILLESGDRISADARLIEVHNLQVDESILTGESLSVTKEIEKIKSEVTLADRKNMIYAGTTVTTGRAIGVITGIGIHTEIGKIASNVVSKKDEASPLTIRMNEFSKQISILIIIIAIIIAIVLFVKGEPGTEIFLSVIALSVSAMPEGLPLALTMALTIASNKMAKKSVVVKKLNSVEALGSCTVIASDKTGTLTINKQTAKKIVTPDACEYDITGIGYDDSGEVKGIDNADIKKAEEIALLGAINNEAKLTKEKGKWHYLGDSIDIAFLALGKKTKVPYEKVEIIDQIPYESQNKYSAVFYKKDNETYCTVKGSLEKILEFSKYMDVNNKKSKIDIAKLKKQNEELASEGYRVIAIADGKVENFVKKDSYKPTDIRDLTFKGLVGFIDPIREEAADSIKKCMTAGIKVLMITGDHPLTALKIGKDLGLVTDNKEIATGDDVNKFLEKGEKEFDKFIKDKKVFARVTPMDKLAIIESLKRQREFVAVTGDGVNDAPAIKSANIGIAMGSGTDVAKETANMIVLDDDFTSIVKGVEEGRTAYNNIRKVSYMLLSCGLAEVLFFILSIVFNLPMPLVAIQLLWLNIVTDGLQDFALSFEKTEPGTMHEKPRATTETIFNKELLTEVLVAGLTIGLIVFGVWYYLVNVVNMEIHLARGYIMVLMVFLQNMHVLNCRSEKTSIFKMPFNNPLIIVTIVGAIILQVIVMEVPFLSEFLNTTTVPVVDMLKLFVFSLIIILVMEIFKFIKNKKRR